MQHMWIIIFFINIWLILTAIRWPFCSPSHVSRTSGQILRELVWCGLRFWCKHEWTSVEQMASWRVWRSHLQTTVWRWQGPPTAALCGKHHMPPVLHPNIFLEESCFNEVLCKLQNYITITIQYLKGLIIGIQTLQFGGGVQVQVFGLLWSKFLAMPIGHSAEKSRVCSTGPWLS